MLPHDHPTPNRPHRIYATLTNHCNRACPWCSTCSSPRGGTFLDPQRQQRSSTNRTCPECTPLFQQGLIERQLMLERHINLPAKIAAKRYPDCNRIHSRDLDATIAHELNHALSEDVTRFVR